MEVSKKCSVPAMIQQPRVPSSGLMPASDVVIRAKEVSMSSFATSHFTFEQESIHCGIANSFPDISLVLLVNVIILVINATIHALAI